MVCTATVSSSWVGVKFSSLTAKNKREDKKPTDKSSKKAIMDYLKKNDISFDEYKMLLNLDQQINEDKQSDEILLDTKSEHRKKLERVINNIKPQIFKNTIYFWKWWCTCW